MTALAAAATDAVGELQPWVWTPRPDVMLLVVVLVGGYSYALSTWGPRLTAQRPVATASQRWFFLLGVGVLWAAAGGPIDHIGETYLVSVHMVQFMLLTLVAPPLLLLGLPGWLLRNLLVHSPAYRIVRALTRQLPAIVLFNFVIVFTMWPVVVEVYLRNGLAHFGMHALWVTAALIWWWPILSPLPELPHLSYPRRMLHLFAQSFVPTVPASFLTFSSEPLYRFYAEAPRLWGLSAVVDQRVAGLLMKIGAGLLLWAVIAALFFRWHHEEETGAPDWVYWRDAASELDDAPLS